MIKIKTIWSLLIFASIILYGCGNQKNESEKAATDTTKSEIKVEKPKSDSKEVIKAIAEKYYIPVSETKADLIFTINQNLNFELENYKGSFEGKYVDGKVQFDDKNATIIDFFLKDKNVILKNQNDVEIEFREATDADLINGTWYYGLDMYKNGARMIFDKNGNWNRPDDMFGTSKGTYKSNGENKFSINHFMNRDDLPATATLKTAKTFSLSWKNTFGEMENDVHTRSQKAKLQSLNQIFN